MGHIAHMGKPIGAEHCLGNGSKVYVILRFKIRKYPIKVDFDHHISYSFIFIFLNSQAGKRLLFIAPPSTCSELYVV